MKAYSEDFRKCVIENYNNGKTKSEIISIFGIGLNTLNRRIREYKKDGRFSPKQRTGYRNRKFSDSDLSNYIRKNPSATPEETAQHFSVKQQSVRTRLNMPGITLKKRRFYISEGMKI